MGKLFLVLAVVVVVVASAAAVALKGTGKLVFDTLSLVVVADSGLNRLLRKHGAMYLNCGQTAKRLDNRLVGESKSIVDALAFGE